MGHHRSTAISLVNPRETALYFDRVVPLNLGLELLYLGYPKRSSYDVFPPTMPRELLPPELYKQESFTSRLVSVNEATWLLMLKAGAAAKGLPPKIGDLSQEQFDAIETEADRALESFINEFGLHSCAVDVPDLSFAESSSETEDVLITLPNLKLIDVSNASWEQVLEFRRSTGAKDKLRRLRLFAFENYHGRDRAFVEDDILQRLSEYTETIKEWGFETRHGAITTLLSSKLLAGALTGSVLSSLLGQPLPAIISAAGGTVIEFGKIALDVQKRGFQLRKLLRDNPVTYIHDAKKALRNEA
jgi:hypothetical protein